METLIYRLKITLIIFDLYLFYYITKLKKNLIKDVLAVKKQKSQRKFKINELLLKMLIKKIKKH
jgi:hypothetical protein